MLGLAGAVDDAAHDGELELLDAGVLLLPLGHGFDEVGLDAFGEFLEVGGGGAAAAGAAGDLRHEAADGEGLEDLLGAADFFGAVAAGSWGEGDADGVADAGEEERGEASGGGDDALHAHAGFGEAEVEGERGAGGQFGVDVDEVAHAGDFGGEDDLVAAEAVALGGGGVVEGGDDHGFHHDVAGIGKRVREAVVVIHHAGEEGLVEGAPVDADADGLLVLDGDFDHGAEVVVVLTADGAVAGIDAVLGEGGGAVRIFGEELVAVVVEVADDGRVPAFFGDAFDDVGDGFGGVVVVDGDANEFGAGAGEGGNLLDGGFDVGGVGIGHRLDDDGGAGAYADVADGDGDGVSAVDGGHTAPVYQFGGWLRHWGHTLPPPYFLAQSPEGFGVRPGPMEVYRGLTCDARRSAGPIYSRLPIIVGVSRCGLALQETDETEQAMDKKQGQDGLFVKPIFRQHTIAAAGTSVAAFIGWAAQGPAGEAVLVQRAAEYEATFGAMTADVLLGYAVWLFFQNGGSKAYIVRLADGDAGSDPAEAMLPNSAAFEGALTGASGYPVLGSVAFQLLCVPGENTAAVVGELQSFCAKSGSFLIVDSAEAATAAGLESTGPADGAGVSLVTDGAENAAFYFPWVMVDAPVAGGAPIAFPPSGFVAGIFAATDASRGVWKTPAGVNAVLTGATGLQVLLTDAQSESLNAGGVNCLRQFPGVGTVLWGARTMGGTDSAGTEWTYVAVRRLALFLETSVIAGTRWVVFERSGPALWMQVRMCLTVFLQGVFEQGALAGATPQEAYFVKCDAENNTQASVEAGVVNITVGFAPLQPAEFVVIPISLMAGSGS